jgi:hypothetical protein
VTAVLFPALLVIPDQAGLRKIILIEKNQTMSPQPGILFIRGKYEKKKIKISLAELPAGHRVPSLPSLPSSALTFL